MLLLARRELVALALSARGIVFVLVVALVTAAVAATLDGFLRRLTEETGVRIEPGVDVSTWSADAMIRRKLEPYAEGRPLAQAALRSELSIPGATLAWVLGFVVPWLIVIAGHARICDDRRSGYSRFLFLRLHRTAYFGGKLIAQWVFAAAVMALALCGHALWWAAAGVEALSDVPALALRSVAFAFPHAALVLAASALVRSNVAALSLATAALSGFGLLAAFADGWMGSPLARLWMGQWTSALWAGSVSALGVHLLSGAVFVAVGLGWLKGRDA